jgi:hypothetical protein
LFARTTSLPGRHPTCAFGIMFEIQQENKFLPG